MAHQPDHDHDDGGDEGGGSDDDVYDHVDDDHE